MTNSVAKSSLGVKTKIPFFSVNGSPEECGYQIGELFGDKILETISFYKGVFKRKDEEIFHYAKKFKTTINSFNRDYAREIESMAKAIDINPLWIYALNSRTEIMNRFANECTAAYFSDSKLLGQNWDWASELEDLVVLLQIKQEGKPAILQMTEPGIIGKIGFNSSGLGICLNFLHIDGYEPKGVPTHVLLRAVLECQTIEQATTLILQHSIGRTANFLIGDQYGNYLDIEFAGDDQFILNERNQAFIHTNHYLTKKINPENEEFASSYNRIRRGNEIAKNYNKPNLTDFKKLLLDKENKQFPICRTYTKPVNDLLETTGTVCSIIMDLEKKCMHITRGNPFDNPYEEVFLN